MNRHLAYLKYLLRHKFYVFVAGVYVGVNWWQLLIHDWQKFTPMEWFGYAHTFYATEGRRRAYNEADNTLQYAWNHHQKHCKHHWQYWVLTWDRGDRETLRIPKKYVREMFADWCGAGKAITGKWDINEWYAKNIDKMMLHDEAREELKRLLSRWNLRNQSS
jgi:hypothetical protein